ncbi:hypothetical protein XENOCAPTIV_021167 [Xenoophorus captivus]|uniref:Uncharacterized protein n=1 Tax=Xenoophorus captivus TaxID=1517983 RepID=A0ABV0RCK3_9TELE
MLMPIRIAYNRYHSKIAVSLCPNLVRCYRKPNPCCFCPYKQRLVAEARTLSAWGVFQPVVHICISVTACAKHEWLSPNRKSSKVNLEHACFHICVQGSI